MQIGTSITVITLSSAKSNKATELIQNLTDGTYVHCGIHVGDGQVVDIVRSGVRLTLLDRFLDDYNYCAVSRCPGMNVYRERAILRYAMLCVKKGVKYNYYDAALLPLREYRYIKSQYRIAFGKKYRPVRASVKWMPRNRMFCSEFVVQCFKASGYIEKDDKYSVSHMCSPNWLAEEKTFELVGYMSKLGLHAVDKKDPFLGSCGYILGK